MFTLQWIVAVSVATFVALCVLIIGIAILILALCTPIQANDEAQPQEPEISHLSRSAGKATTREEPGKMPDTANSYSNSPILF